MSVHRSSNYNRTLTTNETRKDLFLYFPSLTPYTIAFLENLYQKFSFFVLSSTIMPGILISCLNRTVGATADALGFKGIGDASRTAANLVQAAAGAAAVGAVASKIPAVQEKLEYSKQRLSDVGAAVGERAKLVNESLEGLNTKEKLDSVIGGVSSWLKRARTTLEQASVQKEDRAPEKRSK